MTPSPPYTDAQIERGIQSALCAMVQAYHKHGGIDAASTGMVNVERHMAEAAVRAALASLTQGGDWWKKRRRGARPWKPMLRGHSGST